MQNTNKYGSSAISVVPTQLGLIAGRFLNAFYLEVCL